jgi:CubicO group peptidase (beta-lactamase class C family)
VRYVVLVLVLLQGICVARAAEPVYPAEQWTTARPAEAGLDGAKLEQAREYALTGGGSGYVVHRSRLVMSWGDPKQKYDLKSTTKSIGVTALGLAIADGKVALSDKARKHFPAMGVPPEENAREWLEEVTILQLANQTAGFDKPGGAARMLFRPGTKWHYSDAGPNYLAECLTLAYRRDMADLLDERVFRPIGVRGPQDLHWRKNQYRPAEIDGLRRCEFGAGVHANVDAMARLGYLYLRNGRWEGKQVLPESFVKACATPVKETVGLEEHDAKAHGNASGHYGLLWWNNADGTLKDVPRDAYWSWGLYDSLILVVPSLDLVAARAGQSWKREKDAEHYAVLAPFFSPLVAAVKR